MICGRIRTAYSNTFKFARALGKDEDNKVALAQISCKRGEKTENLRTIEANSMDAKDQGAELVIFPELSLTGYCVQDQIHELAETIHGIPRTF